MSAGNREFSAVCRRSKSIAERATPAGLKTLGHEVYARFQAEPDTLVIPVVEDGRPIGLIERDDFLLKFAGDHGHARYAHRTVEMVMDAEPAVVDAGVQHRRLRRSHPEQRPRRPAAGLHRHP